MDFDSRDKNVRSTSRQTFPGDSGEGLPYAPEDWPKPGDKWRWKVGKRFIGSGYTWDRYLYLPSRLEKAGQPKCFRSKISVERYVQSTFPGTDMNAFFSSFMWNIPLKEFNSTELLGADSHSSHTCKAGNNMCISLSIVSDPPLPEAMFCDICCSEPDFCRNCCCILCSKTICSAFGSCNYIRCKAILLDGCICGHIAHLDCALRAHMAGTVRGSYDLDAEYFCRRCDSRTDLVSHIMELLQICESIDSREEIKMILNSAISILKGSKKLNARQLLHHIESVMAKLKNGANFEDVWKKEEATLEVITGLDDSTSTSSEEAEVLTDAMADLAEKMRCRLMQRSTGTPTTSSSTPVPVPRTTPPRNVVDLSTSPTASPSRLPPSAPVGSPSSKHSLEQPDAPPPKKIRISLELNEDAQILQGDYSVQNWAEHVLLPKDVEAANKKQDEYILEASLRQSYRNLAFQLEMRKRIQALKTEIHYLNVRLRQSNEARQEEQANFVKEREIHTTELLRVTRLWEEERDKTIAAVAEYKGSTAFEADVKSAIAGRQGELAKEWLATSEGDDYLLDLGERDFCLGYREAQLEIYATLLARDPSFTPEGWDLKSVIELLPAPGPPTGIVSPSPPVLSALDLAAPTDVP